MRGAAEHDVAFAADDHRRLARLRRPARAWTGDEPTRPRQRQVLHVPLVDLRQRAVAPARVVAGVGRPRIGERLVQQRRGVTALAPTAHSVAAGRRRSASSFFMTVLSATPGTRSRCECRRRCRRAAAPCAACSGSWISTLVAGADGSERPVRAIGLRQRSREVVDAARAALR